MKETRFVYVSGDDWNGLYENGELVYEGHDTFPHTYRDFFEVGEMEADLDWLMEEGRFPQQLKDVVFA